MKLVPIDRFPIGIATRKYQMNNPTDLEFFLGGHDLEMFVIRRLLQRHASSRWHDFNLPWGAKASAYSADIERALHRGQSVVLVELKCDLPLPTGQLVVVDHHGDRAGADQPTSLHQVFDLLSLSGRKWTQWLELVAANDRGYIPAMISAGATPDQAALVRKWDRRTQGITPEHERDALQAIAARQTFYANRLTVVRLAHNRAACVVDALNPLLGGPGVDNLLVLSPSEVNFFGIGGIIIALNQAFPDGWFGGCLPERGYWGHSNPSDHLLPWLMHLVSSS
jgi:hypothetical protein